MRTIAMTSSARMVAAIPPYKSTPPGSLDKKSSTKGRVSHDTATTSGCRISIEAVSASPVGTAGNVAIRLVAASAAAIAMAIQRLLRAVLEGSKPASQTPPSCAVNWLKLSSMKTASTPPYQVAACRIVKTLTQSVERMTICSLERMLKARSCRRGIGAARQQLHGVGDQVGELGVDDLVGLQEQEAAVAVGLGGEGLLLQLAHGPPEVNQQQLLAEAAAAQPVRA